jgi:hypothetical protein
MKFVPLLASCAFGLALSGCGDDGASSYKGPPPETVKAPPATATTATATAGTETPAAGTEPPATPATPNTDSAALCGTVLANSWKALQPALAMVGADAAQSEEAYTTNKYFIKKCSGLTATQVDCLSKSENPLVGIDECKINEGAKGEFKSYNQKTTWKISKTGDVKVTLERSGKKQEKDLKIQFDREKQVRVQTSPTSSQWYSYLPVNKRTMLLCNNLAYGAHPISDEKDFVLATTGEHIAFKGEVCKVLTDSGHFVDATCAWEQKSKKKKSFTVSYDVPDRKSSTELTYDLIAGHLVDRRQVDTSTFVKK